MNKESDKTSYKDTNWGKMKLEPIGVLCGYTAELNENSLIDIAQYKEPSKWQRFKNWILKRSKPVEFNNWDDFELVE